MASVRIKDIFRSTCCKIHVQTVTHIFHFMCLISNNVSWTLPYRKQQPRNMLPPGKWTNIHICHARFFLERRGFLVVTFLKKWSFYSHSLIVLPWTFNMLTEAGRVWDVALSFFVNFFLSITTSDLGMNLLGRPLLGRLTAVLNIFHLWITLLSVEWWTANSLEMAL